MRVRGVLIAILFWSPALLGQTVSLSLASANATPGSTVSLNLSLSAPATGLPSGLQWTLSYPTSALGSVTFAAGAQLTAAGKTLSCASAPGSITCLAVGMNASTIANGVVAVATVPVGTSASGSSVALTLTSAAAALADGSSAPVTTTNGVISLPVSQGVTVSSVAVTPGSVTGGSPVSVSVTLSGAAPAGGAAVTLTSSNTAAAPSASVTVPAGALSQTVNLTTGSVAAATSVTITATYNGGSAVSAPFTVNPAAGPSTGAATFVKTDVTTLGSWKGVYGGDGFNIIADTVSYPSYVTATPSGNLAYTWAASTTDPRGLQKAASATDREASCWYSPVSFTLDLTFKDTLTHQVAVYLVDWDNWYGRSERVDVLDANNKVLDTRTVSSFSGGQYLVWNLSGHVVIRWTNLNPSSNAVMSGIFFGGASAGSGTTTPPPVQTPPPATGNAATFVKTDVTTVGTWKGVYGGDGYNVINDTAQYPTYVTATPSGNSAWTWSFSTNDTRALQKAASATDRIAACWYSTGAFTIDLAFNDGLTHQVALYFLDFDLWGGGRTERVDIVDPSGTVLDTRSLAGFNGGQYLVWNLSGHVIVRITNTNASSNAALSGLFFGGASAASGSTAAFVKTDTTTAGSWKGAYGADGYSVINDTASYPTYVTLSAAGNLAYTWAASTADTRALQKAASATDRIAACWYSTGAFTMDLTFKDGLTHQVALYFLDFDQWGGGRAEQVDILDGTGKVLDTRAVSSFSGGRYLVWNLSGHVVIRITNTNTASNAAVSGIFFR